MSIYKKDDSDMTTITLNELEKRVKRNNRIYEAKIESFQKKTVDKRMKTGRVRPKHPTEARILSMFGKKS